jgi:hypothetical protein
MKPRFDADLKDSRKECQTAIGGSSRIGCRARDVTPVVETLAEG